MRISGSSVLITGATGGIGQAVARTLRSGGADLILTARGGEELERLAAELGARAVAADLAERAEVDRLIAEAVGVDILISNAALPASGLIGSFSPAQIDRALDVNLRASIQLAHGLLPGMLERRSGHLLFMSSMAGKAASTYGALYSASKFGLRGFAGALRADLHGSGVGVSAIFPGFIREAGMFAQTGVSVPRAIATRSPANVADACVTAIERDVAEIDVAPLSLRAGALLALLAPDVAAALSRRFGSESIGADLAAEQSSKR